MPSGPTIDSRSRTRVGAAVHAFHINKDASLSDLGSTTVQAGIVGLASS